MSTQNLQLVLRRLAENVRALSYFSDDMPQESVRDLRDASEIICVLSRIIDGKSVYRAFGAPGDWGYEQPLGNALYLLYQHNQEVANSKLAAPPQALSTSTAPGAVDGVRHDVDCASLRTPANHAKRSSCSCGATVVS